MKARFMFITMSLMLLCGHIITAQEVKKLVPIPFTPKNIAKHSYELETSLEGCPVRLSSKGVLSCGGGISEPFLVPLDCYIDSVFYAFKDPDVLFIGVGISDGTEGTSAAILLNTSTMARKEIPIGVAPIEKVYWTTERIVIVTLDSVYCYDFSQEKVVWGILYQKDKISPFVEIELKEKTLEIDLQGDRGVILRYLFNIETGFFREE